MTDPYRRENVAVRIALWTGLAVCAAANVVANSIGGWAVLAAILFGLLALACIAGLVRDHRARHRRSPEHQG
ncbi:hypothetical protein AB0J42_29795 [Nonomuraea sp. NPDC049649]|uniref:hypothetical protein n=1 Tax=Nonomuraea sp. NPDC049649 TaxID=3155776 RepID=UPI0034145DC8